MTPLWLADWPFPHHIHLQAPPLAQQFCSWRTFPRALQMEPVRQATRSTSHFIPPPCSGFHFTHWQNRNDTSSHGASLLAQLVKNLPSMQETACNAGDLSSMQGRCPGGGNGNSPQYSCLGNLHGQRSLAVYSPRGHKCRHDLATRPSLPPPSLTGCLLKSNEMMTMKATLKNFTKLAIILQDVQKSQELQFIL